MKVAGVSLTEGLHLLPRGEGAERSESDKWSFLHNFTFLFPIIRHLRDIFPADGKTLKPTLYKFNKKAFPKEKAFLSYFQYDVMSIPCFLSVV